MEAKSEVFEFNGISVIVDGDETLDGIDLDSLSLIVSQIVDKKIEIRHAEKIAEKVHNTFGEDDDGIPFVPSIMYVAYSKTKKPTDKQIYDQLMNYVEELR